jgi:4-carboxymuconolactone decarboxylase
LAFWKSEIFFILGLDTISVNQKWFAAGRHTITSTQICGRRMPDGCIYSMEMGVSLRLNGNEKNCAANAGQKTKRERRMAKAPPSAKRDRIKAFTPALVDYTNDVVYGDLWERKALSKRDRSLITVAALVATYRPEQLVSHLTRAIANGVTQEEITEVITHMAFYAGWPAAMSAAQVAYTVLVEGDKGE